MIKVALTFDDGRFDNWQNAMPIMEKYGFKGTVYITTGFIDKTWDGYKVLESPTRPLSINEILELDKNGWEIGLHGDKHITQVDDMQVAYQKLRSWGISSAMLGISVPNSVTDEGEVKKIIESQYGNKICYVRRGRRCDTTKMSNKILYAIYSFLKIKKAYYLFNKENLISLNNIDSCNIPSVVVKANDNPRMIIKFIEQLPDNTMVVFMLHSILEREHPKNGKDVWSWDASKFNDFCSELKSLQDIGAVKVGTVQQLLTEKMGE